VVFSRHDEYDYWLEGHLLVVKATGAWNAETTHYHHNAFSDEAEARRWLQEVAKELTLLLSQPSKHTSHSL